MNVNYDHRKWTNYNYPPDYSPIEGKIIFDNKVSPVFDGKNKFEVARTIFIICGKTKQLDDGTVYFTIRYAHGNQQREFQAKQSDLLNKKSLGAILTSRGINVPDNGMLGKALEYVSIFIKQFGDDLKTTDAVISNGWNDDCSLFALGNTGITINGCNKINTAVQTQAHVDPFHTKGTLEGWVSAISPVMDYKISRFMFYDAMSAALKKPLKIESHSMVHYGPTSRGKTVQENIITSTVGNSKELEVLAGSTKVGIIAHVAGMNDIPVDLEEATVAEARKIIAETIYDIANGKEKNRGKRDGDQKDNIKTFRTAVHVTCENPFRDNVNNAGAAYRMGQIGDLLPEGLGEIVSKTKREIQKNYGHFYPLLIQNIIKNMDTLEDLYEEALLKIDTDCDLSQEMKGIVERSKAIYACTLVAGWQTEEVFKEIGLPHKSKEEVTGIINHYFKECVIGEPVEPDWLRALKMINDWVFTEQNKFLGTEHSNKFGSIYGEITKTNIIVIGTEFTKKLTEEGFSPTAIKKAFLREGITLTNIGKDKTGNCNVNFDGKTKVCIKIRIPVMEQKLGLGGNAKYSKDTLAVLDVIEIVSKHTGKGVKLSALDELFDFNVIEHTYELVERGRINCSGLEYSYKDI